MIWVLQDLPSFQNSSKDVFIPVSYTHLDVYKRQIMHYVRSKNELVLPCAFTGIAATLLEGGRTSHSRFKLPIPINETSTCNVRHGTNTANELEKAKVIIWDEASMAPAHGVNAVDTLYKDCLLYTSRCV